MLERPMTFFIDVDGCVLKHRGTLPECLRAVPEACPGAVETLAAIQRAGHHVVLVTGRPWPTRRRTEQQLDQVGAVYHQLVMGLTGGCRVIVNDSKPDEDCATCDSHQVERDSGLEELLEWLK